MPTYEYECDDCGHRFERHQSMASEPVKRCPHCRGPVRRVIYPVGIIFKGSGFYVTDHPRPLACHPSTLSGSGQGGPGQAGEPGLASTGPGHQGRRPAPTSEGDKGPSKEESEGSEGSKIAEEGSEG